MSWFRFHYKCRCGEEWTDEWSAEIDDLDEEAKLCDHSVSSARLVETEDITDHDDCTQLTADELADEIVKRIGKSAKRLPEKEAQALYGKDSYMSPQLVQVGDARFLIHPEDSDSSGHFEHVVVMVDGEWCYHPEETAEVVDFIRERSKEVPA